MIAHSRTSRWRRVCRSTPWIRPNKLTWPRTGETRSFVGAAARGRVSSIHTKCLGCSNAGSRTRQVKNLDIGLILPGQDNEPLQPRRSGRASKTPQPETVLPQRSSRTPAPPQPPQNSSRRTPASEEPQARRSVGRPPGSASKKRARSRSESVIRDEVEALQQSGSKRRKLGAQPETIEEENGPTDTFTVLKPKNSKPNIEPGSSVKKRKKRKSIGQQATRRSKQKPESRAQPKIVKPGQARGRPRADEPAATVEGEHDDMPAQTPAEGVEPENEFASREEPVMQSVEPTENTGFTPRKAKRKRRVSVGQQSKRKAKPTMATVEEESSDEEQASMKEPVNEDSQEQAASADEHEVEGRVVARDKVPEISKGPKQAKPKRKKRKSIGQQKPKRATTHASQPSRPSEQKAGVKRPWPPKSKAKPPRKQKAPKFDDPVSQAENDDADAESDARPAQPKSRGRPPINPPKKTQKSTSTTKPHSSKTAPKIKQRKPSKPTTTRPPPTTSVPITVYRPLTPSSSSASEDDADPSHYHRAPPTTSKTFNPVDVLAQITLERLKKLSSNLSAQSFTTRTQRKTLELYTKEVEQRMRQLSGALDTNTALKARVKEVAKEEREARKEVKGVEGERRAVGERMQGLEARRKRVELEGLLGRIEGVARRGWEMERESGEKDVTAGRNEGMDDAVA